MAEPIIKVQGISKSFIISHESKERYNSLRDVIASRAKQLLTFSKSNTYTKEEFHALQDVSFDIKQGDRVGIIGRNGAGKSTLLKILSRITDPTRGRIEIQGRVASLLEVGTGFHPELTGRENVFLNGAILGMSRAEIRSKFDEIVAFAEVEKFLDTPVKRYSSGMYVRLAFSVAAHLDPEILIVDEVLAVGDAAFQKKCLGKMEDVSTNGGRTVLFVSHNISTLKSLCTSMIYLNRGMLVSQGGVEPTIQAYLNENKSATETGVISRDYPRKYKTSEAFFTSVVTTDLDEKAKKEFSYGEGIALFIEIDVVKDIRDCLLNAIITTASGEAVAMLAHTEDGIYQKKNFNEGKHKIKVSLMSKLLPGNYLLSGVIAYFNNGNPVDWVEGVCSFTVLEVGLKSGSDYPWGVVHGYIEPETRWSY